MANDTTNNTHGGSSGTWQWGVIISLAGASLVLGYIGFARIYGEQSPLSILYLTLQLFTMESGAVDAPPPISLEIARYIAPIVPAWALIKTLAVIFRDRLQTFRLRRKKNHVVICGLGRKGMQLAVDFKRQGNDVIVIESDEFNDRLGACRHLGIDVIVGNATEPAMLSRARAQRARYVIALTGGDGLNVDIAIQTHRLVRARRHSIRGVVRCFIHVVDLKLCTVLERHALVTASGESFDAQVFNSYQDAARALFEERPLEPTRFAVDDNRVVELVVIGFGQMGESIVTQAAKLGHFANGERLRILIVDRQAKALRLSFYNRYPTIGEVCDLEFLEYDVEAPEVIERLEACAGDTMTLTSIAVCIDRDSSSLACALNMSKAIEPHRVPIYVRMTRRLGLATLIDSEDAGLGWTDHIHSFGLTHLSAATEMLQKDARDRMARAIHENFVRERIAEGRSEGDPSLRPWDGLDHNLKESNRQQADHIPVKLRAIGLTVVEAREATNPVVEFSKTEIEILARMEHARWNAERYLSGWTRGEKDTTAKKSPHLVRWDELDDGIREYDREAVRNIPKQLALIGQSVCRCGSDASNGPGERRDAAV